MKRAFCLILTLMLLLSGCGKLAEILPQLELPWLEEQTTQEPVQTTDDAFEDFTFPPFFTQSPTEETTFPISTTNAVDNGPALPLMEESIEMTFSSGAGSWGTTLTLHRDGSFSGEFFDMDMGDWDEAYPNGTMWCSSFRGAFIEFEQVDEFIWLLKLDYLETELEEGETWVEEGIRHIATTPYGLEECKEFLLYLPGIAVSDLPEEVILWRLYYFSSDAAPSQLDCYALRNMATDYTFFS